MADFLDNVMMNPLFQMGIAGLSGQGQSSGLKQAQDYRLVNAQKQQQDVADQTQAALSQIDLNDPEALTAAANSLMKIDAQLGIKLFQAAQAAKVREAQSTLGKTLADVEAGIIPAEFKDAIIKKATTIAPVWDPVTQRLIYAGGMGQGGNAPMGGGMPSPEPMPSPDSGGLGEPTQVPLPAELPDDSANLVEQALAQIPPELATENPALYQKTAATLLKDIPAQKQKLIGKQKFESAVNQLQDILKVGAEKGFLTSESKPLTENIINRAFSTESGKSLSDFIGNDRATFSQTADSVRSSIMSTMMQAYGLGATQMNTLREMEMIMKQVVSGSITEQAGDKLISLLREREGFAPRYDRSALEAEAKKRGLLK